MKNYNLKINDNEYKVQLDKLDHNSKTARVIVNGTEYIVEVDGVKPMPTSKPQVSKATYNTPPLPLPHPLLHPPQLPRQPLQAVLKS